MVSIVKLLYRREIGKKTKFDKKVNHGFVCERVQVYGYWCENGKNECRFCGKTRIKSVNDLLKNINKVF
tara:strand:- start:45 stop:251 length:207 start_codon:yes stop_codon:yes gene_type:complete